MGLQHYYYLQLACTAKNVNTVDVKYATGIILYNENACHVNTLTYTYIHFSETL